MTCGVKYLKKKTRSGNSYQAHEKLCEVIEMHRDNQLNISTNKGSGLDVEY